MRGTFSTLSLGACFIAYLVQVLPRLPRLVSACFFNKDSKYLQLFLTPPSLSNFLPLLSANISHLIFIVLQKRIVALRHSSGRTTVCQQCLKMSRWYVRFLSTAKNVVARFTPKYQAYYSMQMPRGNRIAPRNACRNWISRNNSLDIVFDDYKVP